MSLMHNLLLTVARCSGNLRYSLRVSPGHRFVLRLVVLLLPVLAALLMAAYGLHGQLRTVAHRERQLHAAASDQQLATALHVLAQSLGQLAATVEGDPRTLLITGLDQVRLNTGPWDHVSLSQGTRNIHTPGLPDIAGQDFATTRDARGTLIMQQMHTHALTGGGFTQWLAERADGSREERRVYSLAIPGTEYWLAAWRTAAVPPAANPPASEGTTTAPVADPATAMPAIATPAGTGPTSVAPANDVSADIAPAGAPATSDPLSPPPSPLPELQAQGRNMLLLMLLAGSAVAAMVAGILTLRERTTQAR